MDKRKLKNLVHFICRECGTDPSRLGKVKLQKILFLSDLWKFRLKAESLSGYTYQKYPFGPFNKDVDSVIEELKKEGKLSVIKRDKYDDYDPVGLVGKGLPDTSSFSNREIDVVREHINEVCDHTANSISEKTHGKVWKIAEEKEEMPFEAYIVTSLTNTTEDDLEFAASLEE